MKTIACIAMCEFTVFVEGYGQVVGAPDSSLDEAKKPKVPEHVVDRFVEDGLVKAPNGWAKSSPKAEPEPAAAASEEAPV